MAYSEGKIWQRKENEYVSRINGGMTNTVLRKKKKRTEFLHPEWNKNLFVPIGTKINFGTKIKKDKFLQYIMRSIIRY